MWLSSCCACGRIGAVRALAERDVQHAVGAEREARAEVLRRRRRSGSARKITRTCSRRAPVGRQHAARDAGGVAALARLGVAPVDRAVGVERRAERDVEQAALAARVDRGQAGDRRADLARRRDDAHAPGLLGDEQVAAGQRLHRPRVLEPLRDHDDVEGDVRVDRARAGLAREAGC